MSKSYDLSHFFGTLYAEAETSFLLQAYLQPQLFSQMAENRSILVIGMDGSGKSALEFNLRSHAKQKSSRLVIAIWRPTLPTDASDQHVSELFISQAMGAISFAYLQIISHEPSLYSNAPSWARDFMHWFVQTFLQEDREYNLSRLEDGSVAEGLTTVTHLLSEKAREILPSSTLPSSILSHLTESLKAFGFNGVWVLLDNLDKLFNLYPERLEKFLSNFLSTLDLFEEPVFAFKIIVSSRLGSQLQKTRGVLTRRFSVFSLKWQEDELIRLTQRRIVLATGKESLTLSRLCENEWFDWIKKYAGESPRGWLKLTHPILTTYLEKGRSLTKNEWLDAYRQSPPLLRIDLESGRTFIGQGELSVVGTGYKLLRYLYENQHRPCTKSELYYQAHQGLEKEPRSKEDEGWEDIKSWEGTLDTALYRLRQAIEWDTRKGAVPIYIISERGKGQIHLENVQ